MQLRPDEQEQIIEKAMAEYPVFREAVLALRDKLTGRTQ